MYIGAINKLRHSSSGIFLNPPCHTLSFSYHTRRRHVIHEKVTNYGMTEKKFLLYIKLLMKNILCQRRRKRSEIKILTIVHTHSYNTYMCCQAIKTPKWHQFYKNFNQLFQKRTDLLFSLLFTLISEPHQIREGKIE